MWSESELTKAAERIIEGYREVCRVMTPHVPCKPENSTDKAVMLAVHYLATRQRTETTS